MLGECCTSWSVSEAMVDRSSVELYVGIKTMTVPNVSVF